MPKLKKLYWVTTPDGFEDWFVVGRSKKQAERYHEYAEGFDLNYATATLICNIPYELENKFRIFDIKEHPDRQEYWPTLELLKALNFIIVHKGSPRQVAKDGIVYTEGRSIEAISLNFIKNMKGVYVIWIQNTNKYKIGISTNIQQRLKDFKTGNPENIKLVFFVESVKHYKSFEKHLHEVFKECRIGGEWFQFDEERLKELEYLLLYVSKVTDEFKFYNIKRQSIQGRCYN